MSDDTYLRTIAMNTGAFLRREALAIGYDDAAIARAVRAGHWVKVRHGAYTFADLWPADATSRAVTHGRAVMRTHSQRVAISHTTSVLARPVDTWGLDLSHTHVTRLDAGPARSSKDIAYHQGGLEVSDLEVVQGVATTVMARAVVETITIHPVEPGLVLADSALQKKLVTPEAVRAAYLAMKGWPGTQHADLVMRLMDGRAESVGESRSRYLMWSQGLPLPELQYEVRDAEGTLLGTTDFAWPKYGLLGEFDGKVKYGRYLRPGEAPGDAVFREKKREDLLRRVTGWGFVRLVWADLYSPAATAAYIRSMLRQVA